MVSHRIADDRLGPVKDDLLLALRRIQLDLDAYREEPHDPASLESMVETISQIRSPLVALGHREAVAFLDEMGAEFDVIETGLNEMIFDRGSLPSRPTILLLEPRLLDD